MVIFMAFAMASCKDDDNKPQLPSTNTTTKGEELVGTWIEDTADDAPYILVFNSDNTGTLSYKFSDNDESRATLSYSQSFKWTVGTTADGITYCNILTTSGDEILDDGRYTYIVIGNNMSFGNLRFKK